MVKLWCNECAMLMIKAAFGEYLKPFSYSVRPTYTFRILIEQYTVK